MAKSVLDELITLLAQHEKGLHDLYFAYAELFPGHREFWLGLADDEAMHAEMVEELAARTTGWTVTSDEVRFRPAAVSKAIDYVSREIAHAKGKGLTYGEALSIAVFLENSVVESRFYEAFANAPVDLDQAFARMRALVHAHVKRVDDAWAREQDTLAPPR